VDELLLEVGEALVAYEIFFRGESHELSALTLVTNKVSVLGRRKLHEACEVVFAVELKQGLKGWQAGEVGKSGLDEVDLGRLALEH
jgi:hypothetical protein